MRLALTQNGGLYSLRLLPPSGHGIREQLARGEGGSNLKGYKPLFKDYTGYKDFYIPNNFEGLLSYEIYESYESE